MQISYSCYNRKYEERCLNFGQTRRHLFTQMPSVLFGMSVISFAIKKELCMSLEHFEYFHTLASSTDL